MNTSKTCYLPSGIADPSSTPCNLEAENSACCHPDDICLSNGLCVAATGESPNMLLRCSCTDPQFTNRNCPQYCDDAQFSQDAILFLAHFDSPAVQQGYYCCNGFAANSSECLVPTRGSTEPFVVPNANVITNRTNGVQQPLNNTLGPNTITVTNTPSSTPNSTSGAEVDRATSTDGLARLLPPHSVTRDMQIGVGVGVPLTILFLIASILVYLQTRRRRNLERMLATTKQQLTDAYGAKKERVREGEYAQCIDGTPIAELGAPVVELGASQARGREKW